MPYSNIQIRTINDGRYELGDNLNVWNRRQILQLHAYRMCFPKNPDRSLKMMNSDGLIPQNHHARWYYEYTHEFKFVRLGMHRLRIINLIDSQFIEIESNKVYNNPFKNDRPEYMADVNEHISRLRANRKFKIFGLKDGEFWYGGRSSFTVPRLQNVWIKIQENTGKAPGDAEFRRVPMGSDDLRNNMILELPDIPDGAVAKLIEPLEDFDNIDPQTGLPTKVKRRRHRTRWDEVLGFTVEEINQMKDYNNNTYDSRESKSFTKETMVAAMRRKLLAGGEEDAPSDILD
jgi:hypothetical protein